MSKKTEPTLFRLHFYQNGKPITLHAKHIIINEALMGFIGVEKLVFRDGETDTINLAEEKLKAEFSDVQSFYISYQDVIRIDSVKARGASKMLAAKEERGDNILCPPAFGRILTPQFPRED